jgi:hypothetical protein
LKSSGALETEGRVWFRQALNEGVMRSLDVATETLAGRPGLRMPISELPKEAIEPLTRIAGSILPGSRPVRVVAFDKSGESNWALPWHRDHVITVADTAEVDGFTNWTLRNGVWHVRPPLALLERMIFLRVLLDDTAEDSGDLEIAVGSHLSPSSQTAHDLDAGCEPVVEKTFGNRGDVLALKALVLHRSGAAGQIGRRRAIRIDFSADTLPEALNWAN